MIKSNVLNSVSYQWICVWMYQRTCRALLGRMRNTDHKQEAQQPALHRRDLQRKRPRERQINCSCVVISRASEISKQTQCEAG